MDIFHEFANFELTFVTKIQVRNKTKRVLHNKRPKEEFVKYH